MNLNTLYEDMPTANHLKSNTISCTYLTIDQLDLNVNKFIKVKLQEYNSYLFSCY
jgi:hypothetical protein